MGVTTQTTQLATTQLAFQIARHVVRDAAASAEAKNIARRYVLNAQDTNQNRVDIFMHQIGGAYGLTGSKIYDLKLVLDTVTGGEIQMPDAGTDAGTEDEVALHTDAESDADWPDAIAEAEAEAEAVANDEAEADSENDEPNDEPRGISNSVVVNGKALGTAQAIAQTGRHLGDLCGWSLTGPRSQAVVEEAATQCGILEDLALPKQTPPTCYKKAIRQVFGSGRKDERKWMAVLVEHTNEKIIHSLVATSVIDDQDDVVSTKDAAFTTEIKVGFNKIKYRDGAPASECLVVEDENHPAAIRLRAAYTEMADTYISGDIRFAFQAAFEKWDACPVLPHGGLWYIPSVHAAKVRAWNQFMGLLRMTTIIIPTFDTEETIESLKAATTDGLESQLTEIVTQLENYAANGWASTRTSTMEARLEDFENLRRRAELYRNIVGTTVEELTTRVEQAAIRLNNDIMNRKEAEIRDDAEARAVKLSERLRRTDERRTARQAERNANTGAVESDTATEEE